jgi:hypothetical protein
VRARILTADVETGRLSLGLKPSYFADAPEAGDADAMEEDALADDGAEDAADGDAQMADDSEEEEAPAPPVRKAAAAKAAAAAAKAAAAAAPKSAAKPAAKATGPPDKAAVAQLMRDSRALFAADADGEDDELAFTWTVRHRNTLVCVALMPCALLTRVPCVLAGCARRERRGRHGRRRPGG